MPRKWTVKEEQDKRQELIELYMNQNLTMFQIAPILKISPGRVYDRLVRLGIPTKSQLSGKRSHNARILHVPPLDAALAEFYGIMLGDGHIGTGQFTVTVNVKTDALYVSYLQDLIESLFSFRPRVTRVNEHSCVNVYVTSTHLMSELREIGLFSSNKVRDQVGIPEWIFERPEYQNRFVRGFFDTDGSIYLLKHFDAAQMLFKNKSMPLLNGIRQLLLSLGYRPSRISGYSVYVTRRRDIERYVLDIGFGNFKHLERAARFGIHSAVSAIRSGSPGVVRERPAEYYGDQCVTVPLTLN